ncbi:hypothetical protein KJK34_05920 [Flavobacterium sp. D11R37]|uniref:hypothetical protein n=1 Tax=Flavobacterium coralii TaxID=2838017 RepID=UPI001CA6BF69|nr:hypothetical protein [Flavobacterium coralii]MBY8962284.1 hypothetical protein [Flavobacterium coralii]
MRKMMMLSGAIAALLLASCKDKKEEPEMPATPPPVENPAPPATPEPTVNTTVPVEEDNDGTSVNINEDGVSVQNKNGDKENNVTISRDKKEIQIKTD